MPVQMVNRTLRVPNAKPVPRRAHKHASVVGNTDGLWRAVEGTKVTAGIDVYEDKAGVQGNDTHGAVGRKGQSFHTPPQFEGLTKH